jgi:hypothetical protein
LFSQTRARISAVIGVLLFPLLAPGLPSWAGAGGAEPTPRVDGPITGGTHGRAFNTWPWPLKDYGYEQAEYFISGTAKAYGVATPPATYKVRIQVLRPINPGKASGTAIAEWSNVTAQYEIPLGWVWTHPQVMAAGHVYVNVGAQEVGVCGNKVPAPGAEVCSPTSLKGWDAERYGSLHHPGDEYSFDIYSQAVQAVLHPGKVNPVSGLRIQNVIAYGQSQSSTRLDDYLCNGADARARLIDAAIVDADGGAGLACRPRVPVIKLWSEESATPGASTTGPNLRIWMLPGAPHEDAWQSKYEEAWTNYNNLGQAPSLSGNREMQADAGNYGQEALSPSGETATCLPNGDSYPHRYANDAAIEALRVWITRGTPAPTFPSISFAAPSTLVKGADFERDAYLNVVGGLRSPVLDVPVATYVGPTCGLFGETIPFTPVQLSQLYPTHKVYVDKMYASIDAAIRKGSMIPPDGSDLMQRACAAPIGGASSSPCPVIRATSPYQVGLHG